MDELTPAGSPSDRARASDPRPSAPERARESPSGERAGASDPSSRRAVPSSASLEMLASPAPPGRPIVAVCAAVFAGSLAGAAGWIGADAAAIAFGVSCASALFALASKLHACRRGARMALLVFVGCAAAWRASVDRARADRTDAAPSVAPADVADVGPSSSTARDPTAPRAGTWITTGIQVDTQRGEVEGIAERFECARDLVRDGESIVLLPGEEARRWPRGPIGGPSAENRIAEPARRLLPDEIVRVRPAADGLESRVPRILAHVRDRLLARCDAIRDPLTRALAKALLLGDMAEMPREVSELFVRVGTYHVLAISGSQVGLVAVLLLWPLSRFAAFALRCASRGRAALPPEALHVAALVVFVPIAGAGAPVLRSAISYALGACATRAPMQRPIPTMPTAARVREKHIRLGRRADALSLWSLALTSECLLHSAAPLSVSVQLSYAATLGLMLGTGPILRRLRALLPAEGRIEAVDDLGRTRAIAWRAPAQRILDLSYCSIAASLAAVLATLPFVWARFGEWSPVGILATPALGLAMAWLLALGWLWLLAPWLVSQVLIDLPARAMLAEMRFFDQWPGSPDPLPPRPFALLAAATVATFVWLARESAVRARDRGSDRSQTPNILRARFGARGSLESAPNGDGVIESAPGGSVLESAIFERCAPWISSRGALRIACALWTAILLPWAAAPARFELWALDVGHGTAVVARAPGAGTWLFDAGSRDRPDVAREALLPLLRAWETSSVDVVLSHTDRDHDGAFAYVIERYPPRIWAGALPAQCRDRLPKDSLAFDVGAGRLELPRASDSEITLELWRGSEHAGNEGSRSLFIRCGAHAILLSGDAEDEGLTLLGDPSRGRVAAPLDLLLFPHHGSEIDRLGALLANTRPAEIWISCSGTPPVLAELERRGILCRTTARSGPLHFEIDARAEDTAR